MLKKNNKGFTLIELLVVIAIIGILAVVAVPALFKNIGKAKVVDLLSDYNAFKSASLSYYTDNNNAFENDKLDWEKEIETYIESYPTKPPIGGKYKLNTSGFKPIKYEYMNKVSDKGELESTDKQAIDWRLALEVTNHGVSDDDKMNITKDQLIQLVKSVGKDNLIIIDKPNYTWNGIYIKLIG